MNQMLLDFGNQWICSPIEFCCLFSQVLMVEIKDCLRDEGATMEEREVSFGLFSFELNRWRRRMTVVSRPKWYLYLLGPNGRLWAALPP